MTVPLCSHLSRQFITLRVDIKLTPPLSMAFGRNHKEETIFSFVLFAVKEICLGGTETRRREKSFSSVTL